MPTFLLINTHSPENCWMFNEEAKKVHLDLVEKLVLCNINSANWNNVYGAFLWHHFY